MPSCKPRINKKVLILTAEFGKGHIAIANKLKSHLCDLDIVANVDVVNITQRIDDLASHEFSRKSLRYHLHKYLNHNYQTYSELPTWFIKLHPCTLLSKYLASFWVVIWTAATDLLYSKSTATNFVELLLKYDTIISTAPIINKLIWTNHTQYTTINISQDFGLGVKCVWWGDFWDYHISSDKLNHKTACKKYPQNTAVLNYGPIYFKKDYKKFLTIPSDKNIKVLFIPGQTGCNSSLMNKLIQAIKLCLNKGYHVTWKKSSLASSLHKDLNRLAKENLITIEKAGTLEHLENYHLIVGKGSYNQISEALLHGTPFACIRFLGYWERQNLSYTSEGAHILDWSSEVQIPKKDELIKIKREQHQLRNHLFLPPQQIADQLSTLLEKTKPKSSHIYYSEHLHNFSGALDSNTTRRLRPSYRYLIKKHALKAIFYPLFYTAAVKQYIKAKMQ